LTWVDVLDPVEVSVVSHVELKESAATAMASARKAKNATITIRLAAITVPLS
jgi:hypothetical protein